MPTYKLNKTRFFIFSCCLVLLLSACNFPSFSNSSSAQATGTKPAAQSTQAIPQTQTTPTTVTMPATQTSCPADGTARALVTAPLMLGSHATIVYTVNQLDSQNTPVTGTLKRYDVATDNKTVIVSIPGMMIDTAQVSPDGQWILFTASSAQPYSGGEIRLQAVRMDGEGLQTLYCYPSGVPEVQWSPDQLSIAIVSDTSDNATPNPNEIFTVQLLHTATGQLQSIFTETSVRNSIGLYSWADNTHLYMYGVLENGEQNIYLLDATRGVNQQSSNLTTILNDKFSSFTSDGKKLYIDYNSCDQYSCSPPSTVLALPAMGGTSQTIWHSTQYNVIEACPFNDHQLLVTIENVQQHPGPPDTSHNGMWIMNTDGTLAQRITTSDNSHIGQIGVCNMPWSHASRDGTMYVVYTNNQLIFGKSDGSAPTPFATFGNGLQGNVVGWTNM